LVVNGKHPCRREIVYGMEMAMAMKLVNTKFNRMVLIVRIRNRFDLFSIPQKDKVSLTMRND
jgi:hypothetical protein